MAFRLAWAEVDQEGGYAAGKRKSKALSNQASRMTLLEQACPRTYTKQLMLNTDWNEGPRFNIFFSDFRLNAVHAHFSSVTSYKLGLTSSVSSLSK